MMQRIHGSLAKLVNDILEVRLDGCIRNEIQYRRAFRYTFTQCRRHGVCADPKRYAHTRVYVEVETAVRRAIELRAFLEAVPYKRYQKRI
jgi:hypothetical protein